MGKFRCDCGATVDNDNVAMYTLLEKDAEHVVTRIKELIATGTDPEEAMWGALGLAFDHVIPCPDCNRLHLDRLGRHVATFTPEWVHESVRIR